MSFQPNLVSSIPSFEYSINSILDFSIWLLVKYGIHVLPAFGKHTQLPESTGDGTLWTSHTWLEWVMRVSNLTQTGIPDRSELDSIFSESLAFISEQKRQILKTEFASFLEANPPSFPQKSTRVLYEETQLEIEIQVWIANYIESTKLFVKPNTLILCRSDASRLVRKQKAVLFSDSLSALDQLAMQGAFK